MSITPRDYFEADYARKYMSADPYNQAKQSLEENREGETYADELLANAWERHLMGLDW